MTEYYKNLDLADIEYINEFGEKCVELWRDIINCEGYYQASDLGRVKSLDRVINKVNGRTQRFRAKILKQFLVGRRINITLRQNGKRKDVSLHHLIFSTFNPDVDRKQGVNLDVDHIDNNPLNNAKKNLQLITRRENTSKDQKNKSSKYTGVSVYKSQPNTFYVHIVLDNTGRSKYLMQTKNEELAGLTYQTALKNLHLYNGCIKTFRELVKNLINKHDE